MTVVRPIQRHADIIPAFAGMTVEASVMPWPGDELRSARNRRTESGRWSWVRNVRIASKGEPVPRMSRSLSCAGASHRKRSRSRSRTSAPAGAGAALHRRPRTSTAGRPSAASPETRFAADATWSANALSVTSSGLPNRSGAPRRSTSDGRPAAADGDARDSVPPRTADAVADDDREVASEPRLERATEHRRAGVRVARQQEHCLVIPGRTDVGAVDAGVRHHVAAAVLCNQHTVAACDDLVRLPEHHLDHARIPGELRRELHGPRRRLDVLQPHAATLRLRDDLLGHDDDVEFARHDARGVDGVTDEGRYVVSLAHDGDCGQRRQPDFALGHA